MLEQTVKQELDECLRQICFPRQSAADFDINNNLARDRIFEFLKNHERYPKFVQNVCAEIKTAEDKLPSGMNKEKLHTLCYNAAQLFAQAAVRHQEEKHITIAERVRREAQASKKRTAEEMLKDGTFKEVSRSEKLPDERPVPKFEAKTYVTKRARP